MPEMGTCPSGGDHDYRRQSSRVSKGIRYVLYVCSKCPANFEVAEGA